LPSCTERSKEADVPFVPRAIAALLVAALSASTVAGCGSDTTAAEAVPALAERLDAVDTAIESGDLTAASEAVDRLIDETTRARDDGRLDQAAAAEVIEAAERLHAELDAEAQHKQSTPTPDPSGGGGEEGADEGKQDEEKDEKPDKDDEGHKGEGEGGGNGPSSGNGPDDGHGN
jgi:hypothetical protein